MENYCPLGICNGENFVFDEENKKIPCPHLLEEKLVDTLVDDEPIEEEQVEESNES